MGGGGWASLQVSHPVGALRVTTGQSHEAARDAALLPFPRAT